jgi:hypothetical protein
MTEKACEQGEQSVTLCLLALRFHRSRTKKAQECLKLQGTTLAGLQENTNRCSSGKAKKRV